MRNIAVVLAGGRGARMKQKLNKVLLKVCGKPLILHIIDVLKQKNLEIYVVVGVNSEIPSVLGESVKYVVQNEPLGTGHALRLACDVIGNIEANVLVINGDGPIIDEKLVDEMLKLTNCEAKLLVDKCCSEHKFGRILRDENGLICDIIEAKDCDAEQLKIKEVNLGIYCFKNRFLVRNVAKICRNNAQNEYYLTDLVNLFYQENCKISDVNASNFEYFLSVNTLEELRKMEEKMQASIHRKLLDKGVRIIGNVYVDSLSKIEENVILNPNCVIENSVLNSGCEIGANSVINNCVVMQDIKIGACCIVQGVDVLNNIENGSKMLKK